jgi:hypothetical protein
MIRVNSEIIPKVCHENVIFEIVPNHLLSSSVFNPDDVKRINEVISIKTVDGAFVDIRNETVELAEKNYATLSCIYQYIQSDFKLVNIDEKKLGIRVNKGYTFIVGKLLSIKKDLAIITVRTSQNEVLVLVHKEKELCDNNFNFIKNYL